MSFRDQATQLLTRGVVVLTPDQTAFDKVLSVLRGLGIKPALGGVTLDDQYDPQYRAVKISKAGLITLFTLPELRGLAQDGKSGAVCTVEGFEALPLNEFADVVFDVQANRTRRDSARDQVSAISSILYGNNAQVSQATLDALALLKSTITKDNPTKA